MTAKAPRNLRRHNVRILLIDEADAMEATAEGSPITLAEWRTLSFAERKIFIGTTPTNAETGQLTSERRILRYSRGQPVRQFARIMGRRVEALDCVVYAVAARNLVNVDLLRRASGLRAVVQMPQIPSVVHSKWLNRFE